MPRGPRARDVPDRSQDTAAQTSRRLNLRCRHWQRLDDASQNIDLIAADRTALEMPPKRLHLGRVERTEHVRRRIAAAVVGLRHCLSLTHGTSPSELRETRNLDSPSRMRPLTVPAGSSSISAIWVWVNPPK